VFSGDRPSRLLAVIMFTDLVGSTAQRQRMGLAAYLRHLEEPKRNDVAQLFEVSGLWIRNVGDRHNTKRQTLWIIRRIMPWL